MERRAQNDEMVIDALLSLEENPRPEEWRR
jgi:hypothetical protein